MERPPPHLPWPLGEIQRHSGLGIQSQALEQQAGESWIGEINAGGGGDGEASQHHGLPVVSLPNHTHYFVGTRSDSGTCSSCPHALGRRFVDLVR